MNIRRQRNCPSDGELRIAIDADGGVAPTVLQHAHTCERCSLRLDQLREVAASTSGVVSGLAVGQPEPDLAHAYSRFRMTLAAQSVEHDTGGSRMGQVFSSRGVRSMTAVVAAIAVILAVTLTPMRTVADDFLNQFRVQKFAAVTVPMNLLSPMQSAALDDMTGENKAQVLEALNGLGDFDTTFEFSKDSLPQAITLAEAEATFGDIAEPDDLPAGFDGAPNAYLTEAGSASVTLDNAAVQNLINSIGLPIYSFPDPDLYPELTFTANVPAGALLEYKDDSGKRVIVGQMASPTLGIPDGVDMDALREDLLQLPGLPTDLVAQLRAIDDWETTLIIPIPEGATSDDITINGEPGLLIEHALGSAVLWEKDGILYAVIGQVSDDDIRDIADSMQ